MSKVRNREWGEKNRRHNSSRNDEGKRELRSVRQKRMCENRDVCRKRLRPEEYR